MTHLLTILIAVVALNVPAPARADKVFYVAAPGDTTELIVLDARDMKCLKFVLSGTSGVQNWITQAIQGRITSSKSSLFDLWVPILQADSTVITMPAKDNALIDLITGRPDYQDRAARDAAGQ